LKKYHDRGLDLCNNFVHMNLNPIEKKFIESERNQRFFDMHPSFEKINLSDLKAKHNVLKSLLSDDDANVDVVVTYYDNLSKVLSELDQATVLMLSFYWAKNKVGNLLFEISKTAMYFFHFIQKQRQIYSIDEEMVEEEEEEEVKEEEEEEVKEEVKEEKKK